MIAYGPVPSRRLGSSLGVNNIPPKICSYSCVYCQVGRTDRMQVERRAFYPPESILRAVRDQVERARQAGAAIDYLTFVPDGEPTLDAALGRTIELLKGLGIKIGVISNASLIWQPPVREGLMGADWVSLKLDAVQEVAWRRVNRPHGSLRLDTILEGALDFARSYRGELVTETMLVEGVNDSAEQMAELGDFLARLGPNCAYLAIPTRPPAEDWVRAPDEEVVNRAYQILRQRVASVETLIGYEGNAFAFTGNVVEDLLSITAVHPMRQEAVGEFLGRAGADWPVVRELVDRGDLVELDHQGHRFYLRRFKRHLIY